MTKIKVSNGKLYKLVYCKYIRRNGRIIYPKNGKAFRFWIAIDKTA